MYNDLIILYDYEQEGYALIAYNEDRDGFFINPQALDSHLDKLYSNGPEGVLYRYENLTSLKLIGDDGISHNDPVARRRSLTNSLLDASISAMNVSPFNSENSSVYLGLINGKLLKVEQADGEPSNAVWKDITGPQFVGSISDIEFGSNEEELFVTFYNYGVRNIWYTANANSSNPTWVNKEGNLPDLPVLSILPNPINKEEVIIGTKLGIWATENFSSNSPTWTQSYNGMSDVKVTDLDLKKGNNMVYAASYGRGMFSGKFKSAEEEAEERGEVVIEDDLLLVYPTISGGSFNIISGVTLEETEVFIYNLQGKLVKVAHLNLQDNVPQEINLYTEASGIYFFRIENGNSSKVFKVIKK